MTDLALQRIEQEQRLRTGQLDLGNCGLTEMPDLSELEWLKTLILSNEWRDTQQQKWQYSQNRGPRNALRQTPKAAFFPAHLQHLTLGGDNILSGWSVKSIDFLEPLTKLRTLNLDNNEIADTSPLRGLQQLESLNLRSNGISDISFLEALPELRSLDLGFNKITDGAVLEQLTQLEALDISSNAMGDWVFLEKLDQLRTLNVSFNKLADAGCWQNLRQLETLIVIDSPLENGSFLEELDQLHTLHLSSNWLTRTSFLNKLTQLRKLVVRHNRIKDLSFLENLTELEALHLRSNEINSWSYFSKLSKLQHLEISSNKITNASFLKNLTQLRSLYLNSNQISDWSFLEGFKELQTLDVSYNDITDASFLRNLPQLKHLDVGFNQITDWSFFSQLTQIEQLEISSNEIVDASFIEKLPQLRTLDLSRNRISDVAFLTTLPQLEKLILNDNQIRKFPQLPHLLQKQRLRISWEPSHKIRTGELNLSKNPLEYPPLEVVQQGYEPILEYFRQQERSGSRPLLEAKLVLLGDGRAGKTSLANRLLNRELPKSEDRTRGVDIIIGEYHFPVAEGDFKLNIWDFAGQDKYKPLHQFFYTEGAVYVLVVDSGNANTNFSDWLQTAELFGKDSPLVIALNEFREGFGKGLFDEERWLKQFPKLIHEVHLVNLLTQEGLPALERCLRYLAEQLPHAKIAYPNNWADIREELEARRSENYITIREYLRICRKHNLPERESALILSDILHKIGVCLHYQSNELLRRHIILNNEWATHAVYQILEDPIVARKKGLFDWEDLQRIWTEHEYVDMRPELLELMQEFKLAYPLPNGEEFVTPPLLPSAPPPGWDLPVIDARIELFVEYRFLPKALLTQFIVSRHTDIDRGRTLVWRNGAVLRWSDDTAADVKAFQSRGRDAIYIRSQGPERRALLTAILRTLRKLHEEYQGIEAYETLPCPCTQCSAQKNTRDKHFFDFANLQNRLEKGRTTVECDRSLEALNLTELLGGYLEFDQLRCGRPVVLRDTHNPEQEHPPLAFFSYSKEDIDYLDEFRTHLRPLERSGQIRLWDDRDIRPGKDWDDSIRDTLRSAEIIFLLLSADFLATDYIDETEITIALERHRQGEALVIPIQVRPCLWQDTALGELQAIPRKDTIISTAEHPDEVWTEVLIEVKEELERWR